MLPSIFGEGLFDDWMGWAVFFCIPDQLFQPLYAEYLPFLRVHLLIFSAEPHGFQKPDLFHFCSF